MQDGIFKTLIAEYGSQAKSEETNEEDMDKPKDKSKEETKAGDEKMATGVITEDEERITGTVSWKTYTEYFKSIGAWWRIAVPLFFLIGQQICIVGNNLFLGFWSGQTIEGFSQGQYMAIYGGLFFRSVVAMSQYI